MGCSMSKFHAKICLNSRLRKPCARGLNMKTVRDYASERGISHQAVYQMMATHKNELEPFIVKHGRTRYLTEKAEEVLDHYRNQSTIVIAQTDNQARMEQLQNEKDALFVQLTSVQAKFDKFRDQYEELNKKHIALTEEKNRIELQNNNKIHDLQTQILDYRTEISELGTAKVVAEQHAENLQAFLEGAEERADQLEGKVGELTEQLQNERSDAEKERLELQNKIEQLELQHQAELLAEADKWKNKGLLDRLFKR